MKRSDFFHLPFLLIVVGFLTFSANSLSAQIQNLRCEYLSEPIGIDTPTPRFTWDYPAIEDFRQVSFRILVASSAKNLKKESGDIWTSDRFTSNSTFAIYSGATGLVPHSKYYWKVQVWDEKGKRYESKISSFETAKMSLSDWTGEWIRDDGDKDTRESPLFRSTFPADKKIKQARVYVSAQGYYEMWINGNRVGDRVLDPGYTHYDKRALYSSYDVTELVKSGDNTISAVLGNGFKNVQSLAVWWFENARWRERPSMICELHIEYANGEKSVIASDKSWKTNRESPYIFNNIYSGDWYDARLEQEGWQLTGFDDSAWQNAKVMDSPAPILESGLFAPIRATQTIKAVSMNTFNPSLYLVDMGVTMSGYCRIKFKGDAGTEVNISYGERLYPNGRLDQSNIDVFFNKERNTDKFQTDKYILKGDPAGEEFTPGFNYKGYQYVEIESSAPIALVKEDVTGYFVHTDVEPVGHFSCSNTLLNQLWQACNQSYLSNLHSIPTDCPQREKNGWTADAWAAIDLALLNYDGIKVYEKWLNDIIDNQREDNRISGIVPSSGWGYDLGPVWDAVMFVIPKALYDYYGDLKAIEMIYQTCDRQLSFLQGEEVNGLTRYGLGDWLPWKTHTPREYTSACYYYYSFFSNG